MRVQGRKTSYGTVSERGSRFVKAILTVLATCQQQQHNAFTYLTAMLSGVLSRQGAARTNPRSRLTPILPAVHPVNAPPPFLPPLLSPFPRRTTTSCSDARLGLLLFY